MKFTGLNFMQGDTQMFGIDNLPNGLKPIQKQYIAASERSGSFHALFGDYDMFEADGGFVIDCKDECILNHSLKSQLEECGVTLDEAKVIEKKDHRHTVIPKGIYYVGIQQRFNPLSAMKERVRD
jgi:hypothetical protein